MASHTRPKLTLVEISSLVGLLPKLTAAIVSFFCTRLWQRWRAGDFSWRSFKRASAAGFGTAIGVLGPRQVRVFISKTTNEAVTEYCKVQRIPHESVVVEDTDGFPPARLHFIDTRLQDKGPIMLYFHGGGYIVPLHSPKFAISAARTAGCSPVILEYTLAPECVYPGQLAQAVGALRLILGTGHRSLSDITVVGESAGGNMCLAVMAHMQQPRPGITPLLSPSQHHSQGYRFRAMLAISPRTQTTTESKSFRTNASKDFMSKTSLNAITASWKPQDEVWAAPAMADAAFWKALRAERVLMVAGGDEVYRDDISHTAHMMGAKEGGDGPMQLVVCPGELHCQASLDLSLRVRDGLMTRAVSGWLAALPEPGKGYDGADGLRK